MRGERDRVSLGLFGDGAANQGQLYESINMAQLWKLPMIFVLENNHYAMGTSTERSSGTKDFYNRLSDLQGYKVQCTDTFLLREFIKKLRERTTTEQVPCYLELDTYRY